jgi:hypothetical protein
MYHTRLRERKNKRMSCEGALMQALEDITYSRALRRSSLPERLWRVTLADLNLFVTQIELGTACGKLFRCSTMAIIDAGDSDILSSQTA